MITSPFTGNFGDHLKAYLITRIVADKRGYEYGFNPVPEFDYFNGKSQLSFMNIDYGKTHNYKYAETPDWVTNVWSEKYDTLYFPTGDRVDFHDYQPDVFDIPDNTKLIIRCCLDMRYYEGYREKISKWLEIKPEVSKLWDESLRDSGIIFDENLCILNIRGNEYKGVPSLILRKQYWLDAINIMKKYNPSMQFIAVSDDVSYVYDLFAREIPCIHMGIGGDYYILTQTKNLILSNSGFGIFPAWLNNNNPFVIAPKYWARHNNSDGYWANSHVNTFPFYFLDRNGELSTNEP